MVSHHWSKKATKGEMYLHSEELFFHPENSFVSILGCFYGYHLLTRRVKVGPQWKESFSPEMPKLFWNFEHAWRRGIKTSARKDVGPGPWSYLAHHGWHLYILVRVFSSCEFLVDFLCKCVYLWLIYRQWNFEILPFLHRARLTFWRKNRQIKL